MSEKFTEEQRKIISKGIRELKNICSFGRYDRLYAERRKQIKILVASIASMIILGSLVYALGPVSKLGPIAKHGLGVSLGASIATTYIIWDLTREIHK